MEGYDTSGMFVMSFVFTLITFPDCQKRAQEEMDLIVGTGRLPELSDFKTLRYLSALINEVIDLSIQLLMNIQYLLRPPAPSL